MCGEKPSSPEPKEVCTPSLGNAIIQLEEGFVSIVPFQKNQSKKKICYAICTKNALRKGTKKVALYYAIIKSDAKRDCLK